MTYIQGIHINKVLLLPICCKVPENFGIRDRVAILITVIRSQRSDTPSLSVGAAEHLLWHLAKRQRFHDSSPKELLLLLFL